MSEKTPISVILTSNRKPESKQLSFTAQQGKFFLIGAAIFISSLVLVFVHYQKALRIRAQETKVRETNIYYREKLAKVSSTVNSAYDLLRWSEQFSHRLRIIAQLQPSQLKSNLTLPHERITYAALGPKLVEHVELAMEALANVELNLHELYENLSDKKSFLAALPTRKPAPGDFTSGFGVRQSPHGGRDKMHEGVDVANAYGTPIRATADGTIRFAGRKGGYGRIVIIDHGYGLETWYAHCWKILVRRNQKIRRGNKIALMGSSGRSTGPHVHYEVRVNKVPVDPLTYILEE